RHAIAVAIPRTADATLVLATAGSDRHVDSRATRQQRMEPLARRDVFDPLYQRRESILPRNVEVSVTEVDRPLAAVDQQPFLLALPPIEAVGHFGSIVEVARHDAIAHAHASTVEYPGAETISHGYPIQIGDSAGLVSHAIAAESADGGITN